MAVVIGRGRGDGPWPWPGGRAGRDRVRVLRIAAGECREVRAALTVTAAWGYAGADELADAQRVANRLGGVLHGLVAKLA